VARAKSFTGPYEVYANNPILSENDKWKCMGHGTFVKGANGAELYLHHAYNKESAVFTGRQGLVSELIWPKNGEWPSFKTQQIMGSAVADIHDSFITNTVAKYWQWDFRNSSPVVKQHNGVLYLSGIVKQGNEAGIVLTTRPVSSSFVMTATVLNNNTALKGLSFYGDANAALGIGTQNNQVVIWQVKGNKFTALAQEATRPKTPIQLKLELDADRICLFYYKQGNADWKQLTTESPLKANALPQWDRSPRAGLHFKGDIGQDARFKDFSIVNR
jgi:beta-xylosidase